ncbi:cuticle protein-like [Anabrus simplex]|uniref:cuticle protein-like n=1 Tax=Anabrus simplex TaxID=316456 RepID=UPI0035A382DB
MKCLLVVSCLVALAAANPGYLGVPAIAHTAYAAAPVAYSAIVAPGAVTSQYHTQDTLGQYAYGYQGDTSAKHEVRTADGITQGAYSYLDSNGLVQSARYVSDPLNGFRVAATNDPSLAASAGPAVVAAAPTVLATAPVAVADTVEVAAAKAAHFNAHAAAKAALLGRKRRSPGYLTAGAPVAVAHAAPAVVAAPVSTFGYSSVSVHPPTVVGVRAHVAPAVVAVASPVAIADTVEVSAARAAHFNAHVAAKAALLGRKKRSPGYLSAVAPAAAFGYSSVAAHPAGLVAHPAPLALAPSVSLVDPVAIAAGAPLPVADTIEVAAARAAHFNAHAAAKGVLLG